MAYKSELDRFDMERGNVLSLTRESAKAIAGFGVEIGGPILFELVRWFAGSPGDEPPKMADPRDNGFLQMLMEHQRKNATRRADFLAEQREKGLASAAARRRNRATTVNHGSTEYNQVQGKEEVEEESPERKDFPSSTTYNPPNKLGQAGDTPAPAAGGTCVNAAPCGTRTATRVAYVEPITGEQIIERTFYEAELCARPVSFMLEAINETDNLQTRNALIKAIEELGRDKYVESCWRLVVEMVQIENDYAAVLAEVRENLTKKHGDAGEERLKKVMQQILLNGNTNPQNDKLAIPWEKWRNYSPGRFLMAALKDARLGAGIPIKRKSGKKNGGEE